MKLVDSMTKNSKDASVATTRALKNQYYILRHGESEANVAGLIVSDPDRGTRGFGLTVHGRNQVHDSVTEFVRSQVAGFPSAAVLVHTSDFLRAWETAQIARSILGGVGDLMLETGLRERFFGEFDGMSSTNYEKVWQQDRVDPEAPGRGIETVRQVLFRVWGVIESLEKLCEGQSIFLVSHGDVAQILLASRQGRGPGEHRDIEHVETAQIRAL